MSATRTVHARQSSREQRAHRRRRGLLIAAATLATAVTAAAVIPLAFRPSEDPAITWPSTGAAAVSFNGRWELSPDADVPAQIGSVTKLVTALVVLDKVPLGVDDAGPTLPLTDDDAAFAAQDPGPTESLIPVTAGQALPLRTLLEYTLVASSNTHARALALRLFGSEPEYLTAARTWLDEHGLEDITIADTNGISELDTATPRALVELGLIADENPVIREITAMTSVVTPEGMQVDAVNTLLGTQGVDGLKTGHPADGTYAMVFTADLDGVRTVGAIVGAPSLAQRETDVIRLLAGVRAATK